LTDVSGRKCRFRGKDHCQPNEAPLAPDEPIRDYCSFAAVWQIVAALATALINGNLRLGELDRETDVLFERVVPAVREYGRWWVALDLRDRAREAGGERLREYTKDAFDRGEKLRALLDEMIVEARGALDRAETALE
jgi:hypothetical protein